MPTVAERFIALKRTTVGQLLSEKIAGTYPCWWLSRQGSAIRCEHHVAGAQEIMTKAGRPFPPETDIEAVYDTMFSQGYARVMLDLNSGPNAGYHIEYGRSYQLTGSQRAWMIEQAEDRNVAAFDDVTNRVMWSPERELVANLHKV